MKPIKIARQMEKGKFFRGLFIIKLGLAVIVFIGVIISLFIQANNRLISFENEIKSTAINYVQTEYNATDKIGAAILERGENWTVHVVTNDVGVYTLMIDSKLKKVLKVVGAGREI